MDDDHKDNSQTQSHLILSQGIMVGRYRIVEKIGAGGMGEVYLAEDTELDRQVALKFLPFHLCQDDDCRKRFKREAQAAAKLDHPNIVSIHEVGEHQGRPYFAMAHIEGQSLGDVIKEGKLGTREAIDLTMQICEGLQEAHEAGVIHRDVKPGNIILDNKGRPRLVDFGLAMIASEDKLTKTGSTLGTVGYMSPEQVGGKAVDHRSDLFSVGVILYEMLTGRRPFEGDNDAAILRAITDSTPEPLARFKSGVPAGLQQVIDKALAKDISLRYQHADGMLVDLRRIGVKSDAPIKKRKPSIAVLPFANLSADPEQEYFCDGMAEEIINALTRIENLRVIARTSAFSFKGKALDVREIGRKLDVETLLEGSVRKSGDRLRIMAQLVAAGDGSHLWSQRFDKDMGDVFAVQDEISAAIVEKLKIKLIGNEKANLARSRAYDLDAYNFYLQGRYHWNKRTSEQLKKAIECFEQAISVDPAFALAYTGLADCYSMLQQVGELRPSEAFPKAKEYATKALDIDDSLGEAHTSLALAIQFYDWDWADAERKYRRALELNPGYATVHQWYAMFLRGQNRIKAAVEEIRKAEELDPISLIIKVASAWIYRDAGMSSVAEKQCSTVLEMDPGFLVAHDALAEIYYRQGLKDRVVEEVLQGRLKYDYSEHDMATLRKNFVEKGWRGFWRRLLDLETHQAKRRYTSAYGMAIIHALLEEKDQVFESLEKAYLERDPDLGFILGQPEFSAVSSDPRFRDLLKRMNLPG